MSKVGKVPVTIPKGVTVTIADGVLKAKGPKGEEVFGCASRCHRRH